MLWYILSSFRFAFYFFEHEILCWKPCIHNVHTKEVCVCVCVYVCVCVCVLAVEGGDLEICHVFADSMVIFSGPRK